MKPEDITREGVKHKICDEIIVGCCCIGLANAEEILKAIEGMGLCLMPKEVNSNMHVICGNGDEPEVYAELVEAFQAQLNQHE